MYNTTSYCPERIPAPRFHTITLREFQPLINIDNTKIDTGYNINMPNIYILYTGYINAPKK